MQCRKKCANVGCGREYFIHNLVFASVTLAAMRSKLMLGPKRMFRLSIFCCYIQFDVAKCANNNDFGKEIGFADDC